MSKRGVQMSLIDDLDRYKPASSTDADTRVVPRKRRGWRRNGNDLDHPDRVLNHLYKLDTDPLKGQRSQ